MSPRTSSAAPGQPLGDYLSPEARDARLRELSDRLRAEVRTYGHSVAGRALSIARVPCSAGPGRPRVLLIGNIHGVEYIGARVALGFLERLAGQGGAFAELRERAEVWVAPCANPDGYARTWEQSGAGALAALRTNARGVDLNRNFPRPDGAGTSWIPTTGSNRHGDATYRGPEALSEPEARALSDLLATEGFHAAVSLHSFMGTVIPARVTDRASYRAYRDLSRAFAGAQSGARYVRLASRLFDVYTGEFEDHAHHAHGTWAACVEVFPVLHSFRQHLRAPSLFWRFNPRNAERYVANDAPALAAFFHAAFRLPRAGTSKNPTG